MEIEDNAITNDEYQAAFVRYRECMRESGHELSSIDYANSLYDFEIPASAVEAGIDDKCYVAEFRYVDMIWQGVDMGRYRSEVVRWVRDCLTERGVVPAETLNAMESQLRAEKVDVTECAS